MQLSVTPVVFLVTPAVLPMLRYVGLVTLYETSPLQNVPILSEHPRTAMVVLSVYVYLPDIQTSTKICS